MKTQGVLTAIFLAFLVILSLCNANDADTIKSYKIDNDEKSSDIQSGHTANWNGNTNKIYLDTASLGKSLGFGEGLDYMVLTDTAVLHYSFDGTQMVENSVLSVDGLMNPLAMSTSPGYSDVVVVDDEGVTAYSLSGGNMSKNPAMSIAGLESVVSIASAPRMETAITTGTGVDHYSFTGADMVKNGMLSVDGIDAKDVALPNGTDMAVLTPDNQVKYYSFTGADMVENPFFSISGLTDPVMITAQDGSIAVLDGTEVKTYTIDGGSFRKTDMYSVQGLSDPACIAFRPGTKDMLVADGTEVKYYQFDGTGMSYNPALSVTVSNIRRAAENIMYGSVTSNKIDAEYDQVRIQSNFNLPTNSSITWNVSADGFTWVTHYILENKSGVTTCTVNDGLRDIKEINISETWLDANDNEAKNLWTTLPGSTSLYWQVELKREGASPVIFTKEDETYGIRIDTRKLDKPIIIEEGPMYTTTPYFHWIYKENQSSYDLEVYPATGDIVDSNRLMTISKEYSSSMDYTFMTSYSPDVPGFFWGTGLTDFRIRVRVYNEAGFPSAWSDCNNFTIYALERPRVAAIEKPGLDQVEPIFNILSSHIVITPGTPYSLLPLTKSDSECKVLVDSVGDMSSLTGSLGINGSNGMISNVELFDTNGINDTWLVTFRVPAEAETGNIVDGSLNGSGVLGDAPLDFPGYADGLLYVDNSIATFWSSHLVGHDG